MASPDEDSVTITIYSDDGHNQGQQTVSRIHDNPKWKETLPPLSYSVTREHRTEPPFSIPGYNRTDPGIYRCICCGNALFDAETKFDSHTGWPSFFKPIAPGNIEEKEDRSFGMNRVEVLCTRCHAHLGHVFPDGPRPTGLRYCINMVSMTFVPSPGQEQKQP